MQDSAAKLLGGAELLRFVARAVQGSTPQNERQPTKACQPVQSAALD